MLVLNFKKKMSSFVLYIYRYEYNIYKTIYINIIRVMNNSNSIYFLQGRCIGPYTSIFKNFKYFVVKL